MLAKEYCMNYYDKLKTLRTNSGMSQEQLAEMLCVTRQTVSKWEQGINEPDIATIKKLAEIFGVTADEIICAKSIVAAPDKQSKLQGACKSLLATNILFAIFCVFAAVALWRFVLVLYKAPLNFKLNLRVVTAPDGISVWARNNSTLLFLPGFAVTFAATVVVYATAKRYVKAQIVTLGILLATETAVCIGMFALQFANASELNLDYVLPLILCLTADIVGVVGAACHPLLLPPNEIIGFRTRFTLQNRTAWRKVNALLAYTLPACCAIYFAAITITCTTNLVLLLAGEAAMLFVPIVATVVYHEILRRKQIAK